jgi:hypothetical protein
MVRVDCGTRRGIGRLYRTLFCVHCLQARRDDETLLTISAFYHKVLSDIVSEVSTGSASLHKNIDWCGIHRVRRWGLHTHGGRDECGPYGKEQ